MRESAADARLAGPALAAWLSAAVFVAAPAWGGLAAGLLLVGGAVAVRVRRRTALALAAAAAAALLAALRVAQVAAGPIPALADEGAVVDAVVQVTGDVRTTTGGVVDTDVVAASVLEVTGRGIRTSVRSPVLLMAPGGDLTALRLGSTVRVVGRLVPADDGDLAALLRVERVAALERDPAWWWTAADGLRLSVRAATAWAGDAGALVPALVTGDDGGLTADTSDDFRTSGLTHLLAVSGTNLTLVLAALLGAARAVGCRGRVLVVVGVLGTAGFVVLARPDPSVLRAAAMGVVALAGLSAGDRARGLRSLSVAVLVLVLLDPWLARSAGFLLSSLATAAIVVLGRPWRDALVRWLPPAAAEALAVPLAAQVVCTPVVAVLSDRVSVVAVAANVLVAPAVGPATVLGLVAGLVGLASRLAAEVTGALAVGPAWWIVGVGRWCAGLPGADVGWGSGVGALALLVVLCAAAVALLPLVLRSRGRTAVATGLLVVGVLRPLPTPAWPPDGWVLVACDVGQGDGLVLSAGSGTAVVVDTGPDPDVMHDCVRRLGVSAVSAVVLTHLHADHVDGLDGVLGSWPVGEVEVGPGRSPPDAWAAVQTETAAAGVPLRTVGSGQTARVGSVSWTVLWPALGAVAATEDDSADGTAINDASLVLLVDTRGIRLLLTGDIETEVQQALDRVGTDLDVDVLKVPHHGSARQDDGFLLDTDPQLAVVSVGADNDYGHPDPGVLSLLVQAGADVERTDLDGDVAVVVQDGALGVVTR